MPEAVATAATHGDDGHTAARAPAGAIAHARGIPAPAQQDLLLQTGDIVHVTGPNGSGKSSLLRSLAGLAAPLHPAQVRVGGLDPAGANGERLAALVQIVHAEPRDGLVGLTVAGEFRLRRLPAPTEGTAARLADRDVATLSSGEARQVALAVAAANATPLLLLDEPADGLDAAARDRLARLVGQAARGGAVVVSDHTGWASGVATRELRLGSVSRHPLAPIPVAGAGLVVQAPATRVLRGGSRVDLPAVQLGAGFHVVTGPNGSGKTTLLERLAGLRDADGTLVRGALPAPGRNVRMLQAGAARWFTAASVREELHGTDDGPRGQPDAGTRAADGLGLVPPSLLGRHPLSLSAGEGQRVALAKVLGRPAPLVLLDEPEAHLDGAARALLRDAIAARVAAGACVLAATHDREFVDLAQDRIALTPRGGTP